MVRLSNDYTSHITAPRPTTFIELPQLSEHIGAHVTIATETFQYTGSFKFRPALNVARSVPNSRIITASSGNFGQAMALACKLTGKRCTVVMPDNSVRVKVDAVRAYGATADLIDTHIITRVARVAQLAADDPDAYVASAYDDPLVINGNASLGHELAVYATIHGPFDSILVPIGGGGLASGIISGLQEHGDYTPVVGAEPLMGNDAAQSLRVGRIIMNEHEPQTIADGARTRSLGIYNWAILQKSLAGIIEVPEQVILDGLRTLFAFAHLKVEPTGALTIGALLTEPDRFRYQRVCIIASGGNVDPVVYSHAIASGKAHT